MGRAACAESVEKQGQGLETLGNILSVAGWGLAALTLVGLLVTVGEIMDSGMDDIVIPILFSFGLGLLLCMALAGLGHLLRAVAQLGRNVHRVGLLVGARRAEGAAPPTE